MTAISVQLSFGSSGGISSGVLCYVVVVAGDIALSYHLSLTLLYAVICASVLFSPCLWWLAKLGTERLLFGGETARYQRLIETVALPSEQKLDLEHVSELLVSSAKELFETSEVCLFVRGTEAFSYPLYPPEGEDTSEATRMELVQHLDPLLEVQERSSVQQMKRQALQQLTSSRRPQLLHDMVLGRVSYLNTSPAQKDGNVLLAPVWAQGEMIAILTLGKRRDYQLYGGPDFDIVQLLLTKFSSALETARVTEELRAANERQKELDLLKDQFIMTASHELRTPLTAVLGYIELLAEHNGTLNAEKRANFIARAHRGCDELTLMVNNMMDANRVQADIESTQIAPVSLEESVVHVVEIVESLSRRERRTLTTTVPPTLFVMADALRLRQVLLNLLSNALKYSQPGTPVEISASADATDATICIRDYGTGVPPGEQKRLFERFVRLERDMNSPRRGTGLGLYICRVLVQAMGGRIWIESTGVEDEGSSFFFTLPLSPLP